MINGFRKFIARGKMVDMAVGVVMATAVTAVANAFVNNLINPLIAMLVGKPDMNNVLAFTMNGATISFGAIIGAFLNFFFVALAVYFCIVVPINKINDYSKKIIENMGHDLSDDDDASPEEQTVALLKDIRRELQNNKSIDK